MQKSTTTLVRLGLISMLMAFSLVFSACEGEGGNEDGVGIEEGSGEGEGGGEGE
jgi:hypothetical protein